MSRMDASSSYDRLSMRLVVLLAIIADADAFSSGASVGEDLPQGHPMQACDAIGVCALGCPTGMTAVAPPTRSLAYSVTGPEEGYTPGELVEVHVSVHQRLLRNKLQAGQADGEMVSAKYIGLLLYAVATGDATETKLGVWEQPVEKPPRFWSPPDPGCDGRALMHADMAPATTPSATGNAMGMVSTASTAKRLKLHMNCAVSGSRMTTFRLHTRAWHPVLTYSSARLADEKDSVRIVACGKRNAKSSATTLFK